MDLNWRKVKLDGSFLLSSSFYPSNKISSQRYTCLSLIPKSLFEQFQRSANVWFLITSIIQLLPAVESLESWTTIQALFLLLSFTMVREAYSDSFRRDRDKVSNTRDALVWDGEGFIRLQSKDLLVGHMVKIKDGQACPADVLILYSSQPTIYANKHHSVGEVKLEAKKAVQVTQDYIWHIDLNSLQGKVLVENPNGDLKRFKGKIQLSTEIKANMLNLQNLALKDTNIKGTKYIIGLVVYTGVDTKYITNTRKMKKKTSPLENTVNQWIIYIFIVYLFIILISLLLYFLGTDEEDFSVEAIFNFILLYKKIIPISLFVLMDFARLLQTILTKMKMKTLNIHSPDIIDSLGQIDYVVTDSSGTISENKLKLTHCMIENIIYLKGDSNFLNKNVEVNHSYAKFDNLKSLIQLESYEKDFAIGLALSSIITVINGHYISPSNEELALAKAAKSLGIEITQRDDETCAIQFNGQSERYEILYSKMNTSSELRSRVVIRTSEGRIFLYTKGPDLQEELGISEVQMGCLLTAIEDFEIYGLRMTILACKELCLEDLPSLRFSFDKIETDLDLLGVAGLEDKIKPETSHTIENLEQAGIKVWIASSGSHCSVLSCAKLSGLFLPDVPVVDLANLSSSLQCLRALEQAISAYIHQKIDLSKIKKISTVKHRRISRRHEDLCSFDLTFGENQADAALSKHPLFRAKSQINTQSLLFTGFDVELVNYCVIVDQTTFQTACSDEECKKLLLCLLYAARSVCFSMLTPQDKANVVKMLKENLTCKPVVMALGYSPGDVAMLQEAHIGASIDLRRESLLKNYSDLELVHFSQLNELLLIHGHRNYMRTAKLILICLYKNFFLVLIQFGYLYLNNYSGSEMFHASLIISYNILFTTLPVLYIGVWDKPISRLDIRKNPWFYQFHKGLGIRKIGEYSILAMVHCLVLFVFLIIGLPDVIHQEGFTRSKDLTGTVTFVTIILIVLYHIYTEARQTKLSLLVCIFLSVLILVSYILIVSLFFITDVTGVHTMMANLSTIVVVSGCIVVCAIVSYIFNMIIRRFASVSPPSIYKYVNGIGKAFKSTEVATGDEEKDNYAIHKYTVFFKEEVAEIKFRARYIKKHLAFYRCFLVFLWLVLLYWIVYGAVIFDEAYGNTYTKTSILIVTSLIVFLAFTDLFKVHFRVILLVFMVAAGLISSIIDLVFGQVSLLLTGCFIVINYVIIRPGWLEVTIVNCLRLIFLSVSIISYYSDDSTNDSIFLISNLFLNTFSIQITSAIIGYILEYHDRKEFALMSKTQQTASKTDAILRFLLPEFVIERVRAGMRCIAEEKGTVSVIFCDICDFEQISSQQSAQEFTSFLHAIYMKFDILCEKIGATKIETVGKTYMACTGLNLVEGPINEAPKRAVELALGFLSISKSIKLTDGRSVDLKIGINSGPVTAGVVGLHKPQFSLVGDTVNTASRMCSTLKERNCIQISNSTKDMISEDFGFVENRVEAKGKGFMDTFIIYEHERKLNVSKKYSLPRNYTHKPKEVIPLKETVNSDNFTNYRLAFLFKTAILPQFVIVITSLLRCIASILGLYYTDFTIIITIVTLRFFFALLIIEVMIHFKRLYKSPFYNICFTILVSFMSLLNMFYLVNDPKRPNEMSAIELMYVLLIVFNASGLRLKYMNLSIVIIITQWTVCGFISQSTVVHIQSTIFILSFSMVNYLAAFRRETSLVKQYKLSMKYDREILTNQELLENMMPRWVLPDLLDDKVITDRLCEVTILYADIVGFTAYSAKKNPTHVIDMLSLMFTEFDRLCLQFNVYKVHTIGDCYVVIGCVERENRNIHQECHNVLKLGISLVQSIQEVNMRNGTSLNMRIGMHTGDIIGGITGSSIVRYDIYGSDVLVANTMESQGTPGRILVSDTTKEIIEEGYPSLYSFEFNDVIDFPTLNRYHRSYYYIDK